MVMHTFGGGSLREAGGRVVSVGRGLWGDPSMAPDHSVMHECIQQTERVIQNGRMAEWQNG